MAESSGTMMGFLLKRPPNLSSDARQFVREHPEEARVAVAVALETAAAQSGAESTRSTEDVPARLRQFVVDRTGEELIGVTEAASRLRVSRTTVYDWAARNTLIAWRSTKRRLNIPARQIVGPGRVTDGLAQVVNVVGEPELAWAFLSQEWPFDDGVARPIERLRSGGLDEVLSAAAGFGATFT
ncbi:MAG: helix-turn-helix domain-containing protein [Gammaproteobacteria bacterium]|nr:helix-turn-helix domain-containing protein [Gammaproteobacteria bacterium]MDE0444179.1 helix-turn-helix domain-containing protein [Gammaproteobacteria bacterium]